MKFKIILIVLFTLSYSIGFGQVKNKKPIKMKYVPTDMILCVPEPEDFLKPFYISNHLTTNKEYFTFLLWMYTVCKSEQSKYYLEYLPKDEVNLHKLFHQEYSDKPVLGISKKQIIEYCQWRTAILNEYILVKQKFTNEKIKIPSYLEGKFGLETFVLHGDYYWYLDDKTKWNWSPYDSTFTVRSPCWKSGYLYPNFRPPLRSELIYGLNSQEYLKIKNRQSDESIINIYNILVKNWNYEIGNKELENRLEFLIDLRISDKSRKKVKRFWNFTPTEVVFNDSNQSNQSFFRNFIKDKIVKCIEKDRFGNLYKTCNLFLIDEENAKPVFIKYDEYLKCFNNVKDSRLSNGDYDENSIYFDYTGFRCVMFAPGY